MLTRGYWSEAEATRRAKQNNAQAGDLACALRVNGVLDARRRCSRRRRAGCLLAAGIGVREVSVARDISARMSRERAM